MAAKISELEFDDWNEDELWRHRVRAAEVRQVLDDGDPVFFSNKKRHAATLIMVGPTHGGRFLTVPLAPTAVDGVWRPVTAWDSQPEEQAKYRATRGR